VVCTVECTKCKPALALCCLVACWQTNTGVHTLAQRAVCTCGGPRCASSGATWNICMPQWWQSCWQAVSARPPTSRSASTSRYGQPLAGSGFSAGAACNAWCGAQAPYTAPFDPALRPSTHFLPLNEGATADNTTGNAPSQACPRAPGCTGLGAWWLVLDLLSASASSQERVLWRSRPLCRRVHMQCHCKCSAPLCQRVPLELLPPARAVQSPLRCVRRRCTCPSEAPARCWSCGPPARLRQGRPRSATSLPPAVAQKRRPGLCSGPACTRPGPLASVCLALVSVCARSAPAACWTQSPTPGNGA